MPFFIFYFQITCRFNIRHVQKKKTQLGKRNYLKQCVGKCHDVTEDKHQEQSMLK